MGGMELRFWIIHKILALVLRVRVRVTTPTVAPRSLGHRAYRPTITRWALSQHPLFRTGQRLGRFLDRQSSHAWTNGDIQNLHLRSPFPASAIGISPILLLSIRGVMDFKRNRLQSAMRRIDIDDNQ